MVIIRPTASLAKRLKIKLQPTTLKSTTRLGDWYSIDVTLERHQFILAVNSESRLGLLVKAAPYSSFAERLRQNLPLVLNAYGVRKEALDTEIAHMTEVTFAKTENKSIIGTMNDYKKHLKYMAQSGRLNLDDLVALSLKISGIPSLAMPGVWPQEVTLSLFGQPPLNKLVKASVNLPVLTLVK